LARAALREGLDIATSTRMTIDLVHGVLIAARLWRRLGDQRQAAEWAGLLLSRPGVESLIRADAQALGAALETELGPAEWAAAFERGRSLLLESVVAQIVSALRDLQPGL
jgi:hypothetical protein